MFDELDARLAVARPAQPGGEHLVFEQFDQQIDADRVVARLDPVDHRAGGGNVADAHLARRARNLDPRRTQHSLARAPADLVAARSRLSAVGALPFDLSAARGLAVAIELDVAAPQRAD